MGRPTLTDDGSKVTLDLHGMRVDDALDLARRVTREAAKRGRSSVKLIHGSSSTSTRYRNQTIKNGLHSWLESSADETIVQYQFFENHCLIGLSLGSQDRPERLRLADFHPGSV